MIRISARWGIDPRTGKPVMLKKEDDMLDPRDRAAIQDLTRSVKDFTEATRAVASEIGALTEILGAEGLQRVWADIEAEADLDKAADRRAPDD